MYIFNKIAKWSAIIILILMAILGLNTYFCHTNLKQSTTLIKYHHFNNLIIKSGIDTQVKTGPCFEVKTQTGHKSNLSINRYANNDLIVNNHENHHNLWKLLNIFSFQYLNWSHKKMIIIIPKSLIKQRNLKIQTNGNDVAVNHLTLKNLRIDDHSGDVDVSNIIAHHTIINGNNGDISIKHSAIKREINQEQSGDIDISELNGKILKDIEHNGDISIYDSRVDSIKNRNNSGDINIRDLRTSDLINHENNGNISMGHSNISLINRNQNYSGDISVRYSVIYNLNDSNNHGDVTLHENEIHRKITNVISGNNN